MPGASLPCAGVSPATVTTLSVRLAWSGLSTYRSDGVRSAYTAAPSTSARPARTKATIRDADERGILLPAYPRPVAAPLGLRGESRTSRKNSVRLTLRALLVLPLLLVVAPSAHAGPIVDRAAD